MHFEPVDRTPLWEWGPWPTTLRRWQNEALGPDGRAPQFAETDRRVRCNVDLWMLPRFEEKVVAEDGETITKISDRGQTLRTFKSPDAMSIPEHVAFPVKTRDDWAALKPRFNPAHPDRFPADWAERCETWRRTRPVVDFTGPRQLGLFGFVRELLGPERTLYAFHDEPDLVHDMMETNTEMLCALIARVLDEAPVSVISFWEDMCFRGGPLISPAMFREFMVPRYRRMTDLARSKGCDLCLVDSDGDVSELIPLWIESGIPGVYPMEVAAGMDVAALRREYGRDLLMTGGIDKRVLAQDRAAIDAELERVIPVAEAGGFIPHLDHAIPHDVPYESFAYYWERKKAMLVVG
jgi:uroporphyrinogen decarboxylase